MEIPRKTCMEMVDILKKFQMSTDDALAAVSEICELVEGLQVQAPTKTLIQQKDKGNPVIPKGPGYVSKDTGEFVPTARHVIGGIQESPPNA